MIVMSLILVFGCSVSAFAADDYSEIGSTNYKGTTENSATRGVRLEHPEKGWKRYDDINNKILLINPSNNAIDSRTVNSTYEYYKNTRTFILGDQSFLFKFKGTKIRILSHPSNSRSKQVSIKIDNKVETTLDLTENPSSVGCILQYQKDGLDDTYHYVEIKCDDLLEFCLDAVDINNTGYLVDPREIVLDSTSMNLTVGETQELVATTTPSAVGVTWKSSDPSIATVDSTGKVNGVKEGTCTITATTSDGLTATCTVTVTKKDDPQPSGDENLYIQLVNGDVKKYTVTTDGFNKFKQWYIDRVDNKAGSPIYKFNKDSNEDYVICDKIEWFEIRK
jgi:hypothetical protein